MEKLAKMIRKRLKTDRDLVIIVSGDEGEGKSRFVLELCKLIYPNFDIEKNICYKGLTEIKEKFENSSKYSVLDIDEAMKHFYKRGWNTVDRRNLNILFSRVREKNIATFMIIPNFWDIDPYYRNHRVKLWIHIVTRGLIIVSKKDRNPYSIDKWHQRDNEKIIKRFLYRKLDNMELLIQGMAKTQNFVYALRFEPKDEELWNKYMEVKNKYIKDEETETVEEKNKKVEKYTRAFGVCCLELRKYGLSANAINELLINNKVILSPEWIRKITKTILDEQKRYINPNSISISNKNLKTDQNLLKIDSDVH
jgi:hypothetical protein